MLLTLHVLQRLLPPEAFPLLSGRLFSSGVLGASRTREMETGAEQGHELWKQNQSTNNLQ
jgi:hypothetical protein